MLPTILAAAFAVLAAVGYLAAVLYWQERQIKGLAYLGLSLEHRRRVKRRLRFHSRLLTPLAWLISRFSRAVLAKVSFRHLGITGPVGTCSGESFERATRYVPQPEDVFIVTQMRSGTTWLQHLVYELLRRGHGDLVESGRALYSVSPWLEAETGVPVADAPRIGDERPSRIIKTHLPAHLCPFDEHARYVYVVRHPVACFASCVDFVATNAGPFAPTLDALEAWFCSEEMWWGPWTEHVRGWWNRAERCDNVLFLRFEELLDDLPSLAQRVAAWLDLQPMTADELHRVVAKCSFDYMRQHEEMFEMHPPRLFAVDRTLFVRGDKERHRAVAEPVRRRIAAWSAAELQGTTFPLAELYPDLGETTTP